MEDEFVSRVCKIPVVSSTIGRLGCLYAHGKSTHTFMRLACEAAEIGFKVAVFTTKPLINRLEQPIGRLNQMACHHLDELEASYPIINTPTELVVSRVKQVFTDVLAILTFDRTEECSSNQPDDSEDAMHKDDVNARSSPMSFVPRPFILFTATDQLLIGVENSLRQQCYLFIDKCSALMPLVNKGQMNAGTLYKRASKQLDCYFEFIVRIISAQTKHMTEQDENQICSLEWLMNQQSLLRLLDSFVSFIFSHSPLAFLAPDFSNDQLLPDWDDEFIDDDGNLVQGVVGYVPLNPADLAALPALRMRRNCWRRHY